MSTREQKVRRRAQRINTNVLTMVVLIVVSNIAVSIGGVLYSNHAAHVSEQKWCGIIVILDDTYNRTPMPPQSRFAQFAKQIHQIRTGFGC